MPGLFDVKKLIKRLPESLRLKVLRRVFTLPRIKNDIIFKLATTSEELAQAYTLLHDSYVQEGFMTPAQSGLRCTIFHALPGSAVLIAKKNETVIATVTLIKDSPMGLPSDKEYLAENENERNQGFQLCEVSALAISPKFRSGLVTFHLIKYLWHYATDVLGVNMLCCVINPKALDFYKAYLNFKRNGKEISYDFVLGAKGVHITRDLTHHKQWMEKVFNHLPMKSNLYSFFYHEKSAFIYPDKKSLHILGPTFTKETFKEFFIDRTDVLKTATQADISLIKSAYAIYFDLPVEIGPAILNNTATKFVMLQRPKFFGTEAVRIGWDDIKIYSANGSMHLLSVSNSKLCGASAYKTDWNTHIVDALINASVKHGVKNGLSEYWMT